MIQQISVEEYDQLAAELDCRATIYLSSCWPLSVGQHPDLGQIALVHCGDMAALITPPAGGA